MPTLAVTKTAAAGPHVAGTNLTYTITVENLGPSENFGYTLTDLVPAGTSYAGSTGGCAESLGTVTCTSSGLADGAIDTFTLIHDHIGLNYANGANLANTAAIATNATAYLQLMTVTPPVSQSAPMPIWPTSRAPSRRSSPATP